MEGHAFFIWRVLLNNFPPWFITPTNLQEILFVRPKLTELQYFEYYEIQKLHRSYFLLFIKTNFKIKFYLQITIALTK